MSTNGIASLFDKKLLAISPDMSMLTGRGAHGLVAPHGRDDDAGRENWAIFREYRDKYRGYRADMEDDFQFAYLGQQYTADEQAALAADFQAPLVFNHIGRMGEQLVAHMVGRVPKMTALPRLGGDRGVAQVLADLLTYFWDISRGLSATGQAIIDTVFRGSGGLYAYVDPSADFGRGDVRFDYISAMSVYWDPLLRDPLGESAEHLLISHLVKRSRLAQTWLEHRAAIEAASPDTSDEDYEGTIRGTNANQRGWAFGDQLSGYRDQFRVIDRYTKILQEHILIEDPVSAEPIGLFPRTEEAKVKKFIAAFDVLLRRTYPDLENAALDIPFRRVNVWRVRRVTSLTSMKSRARFEQPGYIVLADDVMPITRYPVIPFFNKFAGNPFSQGESRGLKDPQEFLNVIMQKLVKQVQGLAGGGKTFVEETSDAYDEMIQKQHIPNATIKYRNTIPVMVPPPPLSEGLVGLAMTSKNFMDGISGMSESLQGMPGTDRESARLRATRQEESQLRPGLKLKTIEWGLAELGTVLVQLAQAFYRGPKVFRISDAAGQMREMAINMGQEQAGPMAGMARNTTFSGEMIYGSINTGAYSVIVAPGSTKPTNRTEQLQEAMMMAPMLAANPVAAEIILDSWDHPKAEEYRAKFAQMGQLQGAIQELQKKLEESERRLFVAENETKKAREQKELAQLRGNIETALSQFKTQLKEIEKKVAVAGVQGQARQEIETRVAAVEARRAIETQVDQVLRGLEQPAASAAPGE